MFLNVFVLICLCIKLSLQLNKNETENLFKWGKNKHINYHPFISINPSSKEHSFPYFKTDGLISIEDTIIQIPSTLFISVDNILALTKNKKVRLIYEMISNHNNEFIKYNSTKEMMFISLILQQSKYLLNKNCTFYKRFKRYINIYKDSSFDNFPLLYTEDELKFLRQTNLAVSIETAKMSLNEEIKLIEHEFNLTHFDVDEYIKYRIFTLANSLLINNVTLLVPFIECFPKSSLAPNAHYEYNPKTNSIEISSLHEIFDNEVIVLQHRRLPNAMNLLYYGFTEDKNSLLSSYVIDVINNVFRREMNLTDYIEKDDLKVYDIAKEAFEDNIINTYRRIAMRHPVYGMNVNSGGYRLMRDNLAYYELIYTNITHGEINKNIYGDRKALDVKRVVDLERELIKKRMEYLKTKINDIDNTKQNETDIINDEL